jgi:type II secretory pathway pseudopilin PulG
MQQPLQPVRFPVGATLVVSLIMLVVLTLLAVTAIRMSNVNFRTIGNMQARNEAVAAAQQAIEQVISKPANFTTPVAQQIPIDINSDGVADYTVNVSAPVCLKEASMPGYSIDFAASAPKMVYWDIKAVVTDGRSGANVTVHQGVRMAMDASTTCP